MFKKLYGYALNNAINKYFTAGVTKTVKFLNIKQSKLVVKLETYNGKTYYNFTQNFHTKIVPKFDLMSGIDYYIYKDDIQTFNDMSKEEQLNYLETIMYDDLCIGEIETSIIETKLRSLINMEQEYVISVHESEYNSTLWWTIPVSSDTTLRLWAEPIMQSIHNVYMEIDIPEETITYKKSFSSKVKNLFEQLNTSGKLKVGAKKLDPEQVKIKGYNTIYQVSSRVGHNSEMSIIFSCVSVLYMNKTLIKIVLDANVLKDLRIDSYFCNDYISSYKYFVDKLNKILDIMDEHPSYSIIADEIRQYLDQCAE